MDFDESYVNGVLSQCTSMKSLCNLKINRKRVGNMEVVVGISLILHHKSQCNYLCWSVNFRLRLNYETKGKQAGRQAVDVQHASKM